MTMNQYAQMQKDFPTMYLRVMRNDAKVRCVAAGPAVAAASGVLLDMINEGTLCQPRPDLTAADVEFIEELYAPLPDLSEAFPEKFDDLVETSYLAEFADLAEEAGLQEVADELHEAAEVVKPAKKSRAKKTDPENFPM